jgi:hypothetical protein
VKVQYSTDGGKTWKKHTQHRGDVELHDVSPRDRLRYRAIVPLRAYSQGGRRFEGEQRMVFAGEL